MRRLIATGVAGSTRRTKVGAYVGVGQLTAGLFGVYSCSQAKNLENTYHIDLGLGFGLKVFEFDGI